jgi:hypothetical protein
MRFLNSSGEMKKYSTPFCSVPLGILLVAEIENARFKFWVSRKFIIVDLPEPDGAENMISFPFIIN